MKITGLSLLLFQGRSAFTHGSFNPLVLQIQTDAGLIGYGELSMAIGNSRQEAIGAVKDLAGLILGQDFRDTTALFTRMTRNNLWAMGGGCPLYAAISAIDMALWDLKGKWLEVPAYQLLGGKVRDVIDCYASQLQFGWAHGCEKAVHPEELARQAQAAVEEGYRWLKADPMGYGTDGQWNGWNLTGILPPGIKTVIRDRVAALRQGAGDETGLILEHHCFTGVTAARELIETLEPFQISLFEEVTSPDRLKALQSLRSMTSAGFCAGEKLVSLAGFLPYLTERLVDIIQPDLGICGGITEIMPICAMARMYDISVSLHTCHGPISIAASLHVEAALPNFQFHEVHRTAVLEENIALGEVPLAPAQGRYELPAGPGFGQGVSAWAMKHCDVIKL
mgnify:CR=1 FL=1